MDKQNVINEMFELDDELERYNWTLSFGKYKGLKLLEVLNKDNKYYKWLVTDFYNKSDKNTMRFLKKFDDAYNKMSTDLIQSSIS